MFVCVLQELNKEETSSSTAPANAITQKSPALTQLIWNTVKDNILFSRLSLELSFKIIAQMYKKEVLTNETVITQGELGDLFYVVEKGDFDVFVGLEKVLSLGSGTCFGELALLYNAPRAATVKAKHSSCCWVIDRNTYRRIVRDTSSNQLQEYLSFLKTVPLLAPLASYEREKLAETIEEVQFKPGQTIFEQGEEGDAMYIVRCGEVIVKKDGLEISRCSNGEYFGERALLSNDKRAATVLTSGNVTCLKIDRSAFNLLLGPLEEVLKQNAAGYGGQDLSDANPTRFGLFRTNLNMKDLSALGTLGKGAFGYVQLVQDRESQSTFALKTVSKQMIVETGQQDHILNEKNAMMALNHPFITTLHQTFKDQNKLYFLLEPVLGGELFSFLRSCSLFDEKTARFYSSCVISVFEHMHSRNFVYRDLKPENLLIDAQGYIKVTDFGFAKQLSSSRTWTLCGTPDYLAPEIVSGQGHGKGVDWWALGILIYEMLASYAPFCEDDPVKTYSRILAGKVNYPAHFSKTAVNLIKKLLQNKPTKRLGVIKGGISCLLQCH